MPSEFFFALPIFLLELGTETPPLQHLMSYECQVMEQLDLVGFFQIHFTGLFRCRGLKYNMAGLKHAPKSSNTKTQTASKVLTKTVLPSIHYKAR